MNNSNFNNKNLVTKHINASQHKKDKLDSWLEFCDANNRAVTIILSQPYESETKIMAISWFFSCIRLGKKFYEIDNVNQRFMMKCNIF